MFEGLEGKVVAVTGSGGAIGGEVCRAFGESGSVVIALYKDKNEHASLEREGSVDESRRIKVDVTSEAEIKSAVRGICEEHGTIDVLVNCAGVGYFGPIDKLTTAQWNEMVGVNLSGTFMMTRETVRVMKKRNGGVVINIASVAGMKGYPRCSAYGATKAGVIGLTRSLAEELIPCGIRVAVISPGSVDTSFQDNIPRIIPRAKMIKPEDVARTALFIADLPARAMLEEIVVRPAVIA